MTDFMTSNACKERTDGPHSLRVLFVEDSVQDVDLCLRELKKAGLEVIADVVDSPEEFAERLRSRPYEIVLADYNLPGWVGIEALECLRRLGMDIPLILVTGALGDETAVECLKRGAADYVLKDNLARLPLAVGRALREKAVREERAQAIEALRESKEQFQLLLDSTAEAIHGLDLEGNCTFCNPACLRLLGYDDAAGLLGKNMHALVHHTRADGKPFPTQECRIYQAFQRGQGTYADDDVFWRRDGTSFPVEYWSYPVRRGEEVIGAVVTFLDITNRKRSEEALRRSESRYRELVENATYGIFRSGVDNKFIYVNSALAAMLGYGSPAELLALGTVADVYRDPRQRAGLMHELERAGCGGGRTEVEWKRKDETPITVSLSGRAVRDERGNLEGFEVIVEDVTERRKLEEQFRQAQKMEAVGRLAGGVAHDFNNLLGLIIGYGELLEQDLRPEDPLRKHAEEINKAAQRAATLTRQLLAFSRKQVLEPRVINLNAVVEDLEKMLRRLIGEDIHLVTALDSQLGPVKADPAQIEQIIMNLAVNSRDAMPEGGQLTIETRNTELDESYSSRHATVVPGPYAMLAVSDTGVGMDAQAQAQAFEPFFTTKEKGTGLGLATVYGIVKQSGGNIWIYSEPGHGTTLKVYLPRVPEAVEAVEAVKALGAAPRGTETVLVAEDEESLRELAREFLHSKGYTVLEAATGAEALEIAAQHPGEIHLLMTDVVMPGMSGRTLARSLEGVRPGLKVLYVSGYTNDAIVQHGVLEAGISFLQKPFTPRELARKVREVLGEAKD